MLTHLAIHNIVLIDRAEIAFGAGLCVLTGETGAGKSILLDALGLVLGARSEARLVRKGQEKATVTAEFSVQGKEFETALDALGIEVSDTLILRRILSADGKSRAFVNDQAVSAAALKEIGGRLVEILGQHQQRGLLDATTHGPLLDAYGALEAQVEKVSTAYHRWRELVAEADALQLEISQAAREKEYLEHMRGELKALSPKAGEEAELTERRARMMQAEKLAGVLDEALAALTQPRSVFDVLRSAEAVLSRSTLKAAEQFAPAIAALERAMSETEEAQELLVTLGRESEFDQQELETLEERLFALKAAARKYNLSLEELPDLKAQVEEKLTLLATQEERLATLSRTTGAARQAYLELAEALSEKRAKAAEKLAAALHRELKGLKMEATRFRVQLTRRDETTWGERGIDSIRFEAATNKGSDFGPLDKIASGGELSRFMLALAVALPGAGVAPTLIFDEIDAGTGGAVADAIGRRLEQLGQGAQVLVVTHLPQVAARGSRHLLVEKSTRKGETFTRVSLLDEVEKREELARMMSGSEVSDEARRAAGKLLEAAG